jgi:hypothetical protein
LPAFTRVSVHDGWKPYRAHTACRHALCTIQHLREQTFLKEPYQQRWATALKGGVLEMKAAAEQAHIVPACASPRPPCASHSWLVI